MFTLILFNELFLFYVSEYSNLLNVSSLSNWINGLIDWFQRENTFNRTSFTFAIQLMTVLCESETVFIELKERSVLERLVVFFCTNTVVYLFTQHHWSFTAQFS